MTIEQAFAEYGAAAIFLGAAFEGNFAVIAGGFLAHQGLLSVWTAFAAALAGTWLIDYLLFLGGRQFRDVGFVQRTCETKAFAKALGFIERFPVSYILAFRFIYGLRMASPIAIGVTRISHVRFFVLNVAGAVIWAGVFTLAGYFFGEAIETFFGRLSIPKHYLVIGIGAAVALFILVHAVQWLRARKAKLGAEPAQRHSDSDAGGNEP